MKANLSRRAAAALLTCAALLLSSCDGGDSGGVGFSVDLPAGYGGMELGMATTQWAGRPFW
ncbi:MAG TPA: hypothetical protein PLB41_12410 [Rubrivivax sp.]|nr:hypothetical protein [Rubrivivax sp.]HPO19779.1 hypothetical protein [Rubrivivax sp.]